MSFKSTQEARFLTRIYETWDSKLFFFKKFNVHGIMGSEKKEIKDKNFNGKSRMHNMKGDYLDY